MLIFFIIPREDDVCKNMFLKKWGKYAQDRSLQRKVYQ